MDKVKLPRSITDSIEFFRGLQATDRELVQIFLNGHEDHCVDGAILQGFAQDEHHFRVAMLALVNGYEVEQTPEDKVRELYRKYAETQAKAYKDRDETAHRHSTSFLNGMMATLEALGKTVEGVNDFEGVNT